MSAPRRLTCFAVILSVLVASAYAGRIHDVKPIDIESDGSVQGLSSNTKIITSNNYNLRPRSVIPETKTRYRSGNNNLNPNIINPGKNPKINVEQDTSKPEHERIPSAVLFGRTCGGTIISPKWILTAGHCTLFTGGHSVLAGTNNTKDGTGVQVRVKRMVIHPLFSVGPYWLDHEEFNLRQVAAHWDFLLAELEEPLPINGKTIAVAELDDQIEHTPNEQVAFAGYGAAHHKEVMRSEMHVHELKLLSNEECSTLQQYDATDMMCAQGVPPRYDSACNGDSGSGLIRNGRVLGVASWVEDDSITCRPKTKVVFSRVASARDWIKQVTKI